MSHKLKIDLPGLGATETLRITSDFLESFKGDFQKFYWSHLSSQDPCIYTPNTALTQAVTTIWIRPPKFHHLDTADAPRLGGSYCTSQLIKISSYHFLSIVCTSTGQCGNAIDLPRRGLKLQRILHANLCTVWLRYLSTCTYGDELLHVRKYLYICFLYEYWCVKRKGGFRFRTIEFSA